MCSLLLLDHLSCPYLTPSSPEAQNSRSGRNSLGDRVPGTPGAKPPCSALKGALSLCTELGLGKHAATDSHADSRGP